MPDKANAKAAPEWKQVADGPYYEWHDHRIHWMNPILPPQVRSAKDEPHHIFDWSVPISVSGERGSLQGTLDYAPPPSSHFNAPARRPARSDRARGRRCLVAAPTTCLERVASGASAARSRRRSAGASSRREGR